jgi:hypothetical protein
LPLSQALQLAEPPPLPPTPLLSLEDFFPAWQLSQVAIPLMDANLPDLQFTHDVWPVAP